jgi:SAM-dependent methyltransferase
LGIDPLEYFETLWQDSVPKDGMEHTKEVWNNMAKYWFDFSQHKKEGKRDIVCAVVDFLKQKGALTEESKVIDIGCGPGEYASEMAKTAKEVVCSDISDIMIGFCKDSVTADNVSFICTDFFDIDIEKSGYKNGFDLVFTSLTPAVSGLDSVKRINEISCGYCFNQSFVYRQDNIKDGIDIHVRGVEPSTNVGNSSCYCMFNMLWNMGYHPEITYYTQFTNKEILVSADLAESYARSIIKMGDVDVKFIDDIHKYLKSIAKDGAVTVKNEAKLAWTLWHI